MGKRKRTRKSGPVCLRGEDFAAETFITIWQHLVALHANKEQFVLNWLWQCDKSLSIFLTEVLHIPLERFSKGLLCNGYHICKKSDIPLFSSKEWKKIDAVYNRQKSLSNLPKPMKQFIQDLSLPNLSQFLAERERICTKQNFLGKEDVIVVKVNSVRLKDLKSCFLGDWEKKLLKTFQPQIAEMCKAYPQDFIVLRSFADYTYLYDHSYEQPSLIVVLLKQKVLSEENKFLLRSTLSDYFHSHPVIKRGSSLESTMIGHMTAFGPYFDRFQRQGPNKVSFYTHSSKMSVILEDCSAAKKFETLVDKYAPRALVDMVLAMYMWWCPQVLNSFFDYSSPYLDAADYEQSRFEAAVRGEGKGPSAYQLYITQNFCCRMHRDSDMTDFTLCYANHPDAQTTSDVEFVLAEYGVRLPIGDGNLFAFRSSVLHGTGYRVPSENPAYVCGITVNQKLHRLLERRRGQV